MKYHHHLLLKQWTVASIFNNTTGIMPTINKTKKKQVKQGRSKEAADIYNSVRWRKLRQAYFIQNPLCELCLKEDKINPTEEIHHIKPILTGQSLLEKEELAYDPNNLLALCKDCHHRLHNEMKK